MTDITSGSGQGHEPCPRAGCGGTLCNYRRAVGTSGPMKGEWVVGLCSNDCGAFSLDLAPSKPPPPRPVAAPVVEWSGGLSDLCSAPSAWFVPRLTGREVNRSGYVTCPVHKGGQERTPSLHVARDSAKWHCHPCDKGGGLVQFWCWLRSRPEPSRGARHEFLRILHEIAHDLGTTR